MTPDPMLSDPMIAAIDEAVGAHQALAESMARNAQRFDPFGYGTYGPGSTPGVESSRWTPETAVGRGWVSPPNTVYVDHEPVPRPPIPGAAPLEPKVANPNPTQPQPQPARHRAPPPWRLWWKRWLR